MPAKNVANIHSYGDTTQIVATAAIGVTAPTLPPPTALGTGWYDLGWIDDSGVVEAQTQQETKKYAWQGGALVRTLRSQSEHTFTFQALEENPVTFGLLRPGGVTTTTGASAEVQTVTITGGPAGGTFTLTTVYGATTQAYNVATATLATALTNIVGATVTVTGTPGTSYVVTFPVNAGNVANSSATHAFTGGASPAISVATTTPGVTGTNTTSVGPYTAQNLRQWAIDLTDGAVHHRIYIPSGEAIFTGTVTYIATDDAAYQFRLDCYPDSAGKFFYDLNDNPMIATGVGFA